MLTAIRIRNFKRFEDIKIDLGKAAIFIGPNNSGKTTALQALALWDIGVKRWTEKHKGKSTAGKRPGITINRRDLVSIPVPVANLLWHNLHTRDVERDPHGKQQTENVRIDIIAEGITHSTSWLCGLEFDYANEESFYCRPLRSDAEGKTRMPVPNEASAARVAYLPPMSGLADREFVKQQGEIGVLIGQGQTAQVLRNLCYQIYESKTHWNSLLEHIRILFGIELLAPRYVGERSEITMAYRDVHRNTLDLSSSGRGLQQTLLLLAHLYSNPGSILLLDEPDAHLEILRQRQIYSLLIHVAERQDSQIIAASHSEVILNEAAGRDTVVAFVGTPHRIDRGSQTMKALNEIGWDQYYQAEETGWVIYLEGSTDLAILQEFARTLDHEAQQLLASPFVKYISTNTPNNAREHFYGLKEAKNDLVGIAIFDRLEKELEIGRPLVEMMWRRREIENYFCTQEVLIAYAGHALSASDLFGRDEIQRRERAMKESINEITEALKTLNEPSPWSDDIKATEGFMDRLFKRFFHKLGLPLELRKSEYHLLARLMPAQALDAEIKEKLDAIAAVAKKAKPGYVQ